MGRMDDKASDERLAAGVRRFVRSAHSFGTGPLVCRANLVHGTALLAHAAGREPPAGRPTGERQ
jgi:hypothetical protein